MLLSRFFRSFLLTILCTIVIPALCCGQGWDAQSFIKHIIVVDSNNGIEKLLLYENALYEVRSRVDLSGKSIIIPRNSTIKFTGNGCLANGTIIGNATTLRGYLIGVLENITVQGTFNNQTVCSNIFKSIPDLESLINLVGPYGTLNLDTDLVHNGNKIVLTKSLTINGEGHIIKIAGDGIKSGEFIEIIGVDEVCLSNFIIDGGLPSDAFRSGLLKSQDNYRMLICAERCDRIKIENCTIKNLFYQMAHNPEYLYNLDTPGLLSKQKDKASFIRTNMYNLAHYAMIAFIYCKEVLLENNRFENINTEEGIFFLSETPDLPSCAPSLNYHLVAKNNEFICEGKFSYESNRFIPVNSSLSSWLNVSGGKCEIMGNVFGASQGSQLNACSSNSIIENNTFHSSRSGSIDLNENGCLGFVPENVTVINNTAHNTLNFVNFSAGKNIAVLNNTFDCSGIPEGYGSENNVFAMCNRNTSDYSAPISVFHPLNNVTIKGNRSINALWFFCDWNYGDKKGEKTGLVIESNEVINRRNYTNIFKDGTIKNGLRSERPAICLSSFQNVKIINNTIKETGSPYVSVGKELKRTPTFITVIQPSEDSYFRDVEIRNNIFESEYKDVKVWAYMIPDASLRKNRRYRNGIGIKGIQLNQNEVIAGEESSFVVTELVRWPFVASVLAATTGGFWAYIVRKKSR